MTSSGAASALDASAEMVSGLPLRGEETTLGQAGYCLRCHRVMPDGPDICIGELPGVAFACCGHGVTRRAYVAFGEPGAVIEIIRGQLALSYMQLATASNAGATPKEM